MANPNWQKGKSGNPAGRPVDSATTELKAALENFGKTHDKSFIQYAVDKAVNDTGLMVAILKKILPDLTNDTSVGELMAELRKRYERVEFDDGKSALTYKPQK